MIVHAVRCDYEGCSNEEKLVEFQERHPGGSHSYEKPKHWLQYDGKDFCSHGCVARYADERQAGVAP